MSTTEVSMGDLESRAAAEEWLLKHLGGDTDDPARVKEVVRSFPELVTSRHNGVWPRLLLSPNDDRVKTSQRIHLRVMSMVPLFAELALEHGRVDDRGGLLAYDDRDRNVLRYLVGASGKRASQTKGTPLEYRKLADETALRVLKELRDRNLFFREDVRREDLVGCLLERGSFFSEQRFRWLVDWDPPSLARERERHRDGILPLHRSVVEFESPSAFSAVLERGMRHFPTRLGFLFSMDANGSTPFRLACQTFGSPRVATIVETVVVAQQEKRRDTRAILEFLVVAAADESVDLDGVYFLLHQDPQGIAQSWLSGGAGRVGRCQRKRNNMGVAHAETVANTKRKTI